MYIYIYIERERYRYLTLSLSLYIYIYIYIYRCVCVCIYIYIEREREREISSRHGSARACARPRGFQGYCLNDTVKGPRFEETSTQVFSSQSKHINIIRRKVKAVSLKSLKTCTRASFGSENASFMRSSSSSSSFFFAQTIVYLFLVCFYSFLFLSFSVSFCSFLFMLSFVFIMSCKSLCMFLFIVLFLLLVLLRGSRICLMACYFSSAASFLFMTFFSMATRCKMWLHVRT